MADLPDDEREAAIIKQQRRAQIPHDQAAALTVQNSNLAFYADVAIKENAENFRKAFIDKLTGLPNVAAFDEFSRIVHQGVQQVTIAEGDLDKFKPVNDEQGHKAGDRVLKNVGELLLGYFWGEDPLKRLQASNLSEGQTITAFRKGGDEFALILTNFSAAAALATVDEIQKRLAAQYHDISDIPGVQSPGVKIGSSFGIASRDTIAEQPDLEVFDIMADTASYGNKQHGVICVAKSLDEFYKTDSNLGLVPIDKPERKPRERREAAPQLSQLKIKP